MIEIKSSEGNHSDLDNNKYYCTININDNDRQKGIIKHGASVIFSKDFIEIYGYTSGLRERYGEMSIFKSNKELKTIYDKYMGNTIREQYAQTNLYQISIPKEWSVEKLAGSMLAFKKENKKIGGLDILGYYPEQPISQLEPSHSEVIESKKLEGFFLEVVREKLKITPPAASGETTVTEQIHLFFIIKEKKIAYDLYFNTADVDEQTALNIAKTLKLK